MNNKAISLIITSFREPITIRKSIQQAIKNSIANLEIIVIAPDDPTLKSAKEILNEMKFTNYKLLKDTGEGKPSAINTAIQSAKAEIIFLTDGDMHISDTAIELMIPYFDSNKIGGVSGHPVSLDSRNKLFGYFSHLFCEAAHIKRLSDENTPMSGYLYAIRKVPNLFPIPIELRAEDAYITSRLIEMGYKIKYEPNAYAYVRFPKNFSDWMKQKTRSLGGNLQNELFPAELTQVSRVNKRSIKQDLEMALFPITFAKSPIELLYSLILYPLRLYLWIRIFIQHKLNTYSKGAWERIDSSKE